MLHDSLCVYSVYIVLCAYSVYIVLCVYSVHNVLCVYSVYNVLCCFLLSEPAARAGSLQISRLSDQASLAADDTQLVLVGGGEVNGSGGDSWAQVTRVWNVQVGQHCRTGNTK